MTGVISTVSSRDRMNLYDVICHIHGGEGLESGRMITFDIKNIRFCYFY